MARSSDVDALRTHISTTIGVDPARWESPGNGWAGEAEAAFLDAVLSVQAVYGNSPTTGVRLIVMHWRTIRGRGSPAGVVLDDLSELAKWDSLVQAQQLAEEIDNRKTLNGVGRTRPLKALAVAQAARVFVNNGIRKLYEFG